MINWQIVKHKYTILDFKMLLDRVQKNLGLIFKVPRTIVIFFDKFEVFHQYIILVLRYSLSYVMIQFR